jgi:putative DNA primase/helicase
MIPAARLQAEGIEPRHLRPGTQRLPCSKCDKSPRDDALVLTLEDDGGVVWFCHRCHWAGGARGDSWLDEYTATRARAEDPRWQRRLDELRKRQEAENGRRQRAVDRAKALWARAGSVPAWHPYAQRKRLDVGRLRFLERFQTLRHVLLVAMRDPGGALVNLQGIDGDGQKRFLAGGQVKGAFAVLDSPARRWQRGIAAERIAVAEGYATAAAFIRMHPQFLGVAAMSAGNLPAVAESLHERFPRVELVIAADQDPPGARAAEYAAQLTGATISYPGRQDDGVNDWSDLCALDPAHAE